MPPVLIALLIALGLVSVLGFFVNPWATAVYLNRPSRRR